MGLEMPAEPQEAENLASFRSHSASFFVFLSSFLALVSLRMQLNPVNGKDPKNRWESYSLQRAYVDWLFGNLVLHMACLNFIG